MRYELTLIIAIAVLCAYLGSKDHNNRQSYEIARSIELPSNVSIEFEPGAMMYCPSGHTIYLTRRYNGIVEMPSGKTVEYIRFRDNGFKIKED